MEFIPSEVASGKPFILHRMKKEPTTIRYRSPQEKTWNGASSKMGDYCKSFKALELSNYG
jgi:hypothetical protein